MKPRISEPERPSSEDENAVPMPEAVPSGRFQRGQDVAAAAGVRIKSLNNLADGTDRADQTPEGAEQAEEDQKADQVAGNIARLIEPCPDRVQDGTERTVVVTARF